jgi:hypothetical protein
MTSNVYQHLCNAVAERPEELNEWEAAHWQGFEHLRYTSEFFVCDEVATAHSSRSIEVLYAQNKGWECLRNEG